MKFKQRRLLRGFNRFRLMLTLGLAVLLPAVALIYVNFSQLRGLERDKVLEAAVHRDFQDVLAITEKKINKKAYTMVEEARDLFPSLDDDENEKEKKLDALLARSPWLSHVLLWSDKDFVFRSGSQLEHDKNIREEHERMSESYHTWLDMEGKDVVGNLQKKARHISFSTGAVKRNEGASFITTAFFVFPQADKEQMALGAVTFEGCYFKGSVFPNLLNEIVTDRQTVGGNTLAMMIYPSTEEMGMKEMKPIATASSGWGEGKPEVARKFDDVFRGLTLGIKYKETSVADLGKSWVNRSFLILGILSLLIIGGLVLTKHIVDKEMGLARLKSDFVSNVSHELRTPLALIRLYAETLELGRISTREKKQQYYRIIRKESERLTALINNILDFSRIEAGRKEYEFRETDIAELVHNTLDSYRYQIEQQGFAFEESIAPDLPPVRVDREAIARALVNLVNNALKYSTDEKFLGVKLYRENGLLKLEVADRGIGIERRDQSKIFEKFYRTGDPLVHNTKGSGLGLSLVQHISQAHGGDIAVESTPGKGSKFILSLPLVSEGPVSEARA